MKASRASSLHFFSLPKSSRKRGRPAIKLRLRLGVAAGCGAAGRDALHWLGRKIMADQGKARVVRAQPNISLSLSTNPLDIGWLTSSPETLANSSSSSRCLAVNRRGVSTTILTNSSPRP